MGAVILLRILLVLRRRVNPLRSLDRLALAATGLLVVVTSAVAAVPVLILALASGLDARGTRSLASWADLSDDALFCAVALFAGVLAVLFRVGWLRVFAALVAVLSAARGIGGPGRSALDVMAPLSFLLLMLAIGVRLLANRGPLFAPVTEEAGPAG